MIPTPTDPDLRPSRLSLPHLEQRILPTLVAMFLFSQGWVTPQPMLGKVWCG
jgi:hypothetical protein